MKRDTEEYSDKQLVEGLITNDPKVIRYVFYTQCNKLFRYIINSLFDNRVCQDELISELFLYLADNNWAKVKQFDFQSAFLTWISVVAIRFFQKKRNRLLESEVPETLIRILKKNEKILQLTFIASS